MRIHHCLDESKQVHVSFKTASDADTAELVHNLITRQDC